MIFLGKMAFAHTEKGEVMNKPLVFNYKKHKELKQAYKELLEDNNKLVADNRRLRKENANLQIKLRIKEADNETAG